MTSIEESIWVEKYRPEQLDEIVGNEEVVARMKDFASDAEMPNIMFAGPQGTGKTALTTALGREIYGDDWRSNMLELNASDERGIDTVRDRIKSFARTDTVGDHDFKIVFLDEVDSTTKDAQSALRRVMEDYSDKTRFVLSCNYPNKIIPPIQSRCAVFRIGRLSDEDIRQIVTRVITQEEIEAEDEAIDALVNEAGGDARKAINTLQSTVLDGTLKADAVEQIAGSIDYNDVREIIEEAIAGNLDDAMERLDVEVLKAGVSEQKFIDTSLRVVKGLEMPADARAKCIDKIAECDWRVMQGANPHVQLHSLLSDIHIAYHLSLPNYSEE
jgi:replication factor C small subunit